MASPAVATTSSSRPARWREAGAGLLLFGATLLTFLPALRGAFL